jgi:CBS domain-containing protein
MITCKELMTPSVTVCTVEDDCSYAAMLMRDNDCGALPVVESVDDPRIVGIITDRDICCRVAANGSKRPSEFEVADVMTKDVVTCAADDDIERAIRLMEECQIRRIPIVDHAGRCVGMLAQADIATSELVREKVPELLDAVSRNNIRSAAKGAVKRHAA